VPRGFWDWKYFNCPTGQARLAIALDGDRIVGRIGWYGQRLHVQGTECVACQVADIDVLESHRQSGAFFRLEKLARKPAYEEYGIAFHFAVAIDTTKTISTRVLGFELVEPIRKLARLLDPIGYGAARVGVPAAGALGAPWRAVTAAALGRRAAGLTLAPVTHFDARFDETWAAARKLPLMLVKDAAYLNWRYLACPAVRYETLAAERDGRVDGWITTHVLARGGLRYGLVDDVLCRADAPETVGALLGAGLASLARRGAQVAIAWLPKHHAHDPAFARLGFRERPTPHYWIVRRGCSDLPKEELTRATNWDYSIGDSDYWMVPRER
jgi:hypothetical protein